MRKLTCRAAPVHRWGLCPACAGQASFCSSSRAPEMTNSHSLKDEMKRALLPGSSCKVQTRQAQSKQLRWLQVGVVCLKAP